MEKRYFGTDGVRGRVGREPITADFALRLGWATGRILAAGSDRPIVIGKDTRISGYMFESALEAGLIASGVNVKLLGPMPTPAVAYLTRTLRCAAGIVISASHNPFEDNGFKFFSSEGTKLDDDIELAIEQELEKSFQTVSPRDLGKAERVTDAAGRYIEFCKATLPGKSDLRGLRLVVDCANGAAYHVGPRVFEELGAQVHKIAAEPDGLNINVDCGSTSLGTLQSAVAARSADVGIAFDGDGDRMLMVDRDGNVVDGDQLLYVLAVDRQRRGALRGGVVGTLMSNHGLEIALRQADIPFRRARVGDRYVQRMLDELSWQLGGESSGHLLLLDAASTGDGIVSALAVLDVLMRTGKQLHELVADMPVMPQHMINVPVAQRVNPDTSEDVRRLAAEIQAELAEDGRVILRASGTEALIRVTVEAQDERKAQAYAARLAECVEQNFGRA